MVRALAPKMIAVRAPGHHAGDIITALEARFKLKTAASKLPRLPSARAMARSRNKAARMFNAE